ncbi:MAG: hypothetical protein HQL42_05435 [Alphaproteobacteria bacterium]|nr:hypothetical protein [Alphaproteobacteria bacterium]
MAAITLQFDHTMYSIITRSDGSSALHCSLPGVADVPLLGANTYSFSDHWTYAAASRQWGIVATAADQSFLIPDTGSLLKTIQGKFANDSVVLGYSHDNYLIERNANGSLTVTDRVHQTLQGTVISGISALKFSDGLTYVPSQGKLVQFGTSGNDTLKVNIAAQVIDGGGGTNTVVFAKAQSAYEVKSGAAGSFTILDKATQQTTIASNVQVLKFADGGRVGLLEGTAGNDTLQVTGLTRLVTGKGGLDEASFTNYSNWYRIEKSAGGGLDVTDIHATGTRVHLDGIAALTFKDGLRYDAASAKLVQRGTGGDDSLKVAAGAQVVDGGAGVNTAIFAKVQSAYTVTSGAGGAFTVVDVATTRSVIASHIQVLKFADGTTLGTVDGTAGNDILKVTANTRLVDGHGGLDTAAFANYSSWYSIARNAGGSVDVTDIHATGTVVHLDGISKIAFSNAVYDVATGTYATPPVAAPVVPASGGVVNSGVVHHAPTVQAATGANDIVAVHLENNTSTASAARTVSFGQVFAKGDLPAGTSLVAMVDGQPVAVQIDVRTHHQDGSVQQAVLSLAAPSIGAGSAIDIMLGRGSGTAATPSALDPHGFVGHGYDTQVTLTFHNADGSSSVRTVDAGQVLSDALAAGTARTVLSGPQAGEVQVDAAINGSLHVVMNIRGNADGTFLTDVQVRNDRIFSADAKTYDYDVAISSHGQVQFAEAGLSHVAMQEWHKEVWSDARAAISAPASHVVYDVAYLEQTGAVMGYDTSVGVAANSINADLAAIAKGDHSLLGNSQVVQYQPMTGGRGDIGITSKWNANWLVSQNQVGEQVMLASADAAGSSPFHAVNADGSLITIDSHPTLWLDGRNQSTVKPANNFDSIQGATGWVLDTAHIPELGYMAALTQGSDYYVRQVQAQANYDLLSYNPGYRGGSTGIVMGEIREIAWVIRDLADAAYVTADGDPLKAYYTEKLENNIQNLIDQYVGTAKGAAQGQLQGYVFDSYHATITAPWQQDFLTLAMAHAADLGFAGAKEFMAWQNNFTAGRFLHGEDGYNPLNGAGYWINIADPAADTTRYAPTGSGDPGVALFQTWGEVYASTYGGQAVPTQMSGSPNDASGGYAAIAKAALAVQWDASHDIDDLAAYAYVTSQTPGLIKGATGYAATQTWDITPTLSDGHHLQNSEVLYGTGGTTQATSAHGLLAALSGNNVLVSGNGDSILIGGSGTDVLRGGGGDDFLFGAGGTTRIEGWAGTNILKGGAGADTFVFQTGTAAHDTVIAFKAGFDTLEISTGGSAMTALDVMSGATANADGDAVLHLSDRHDVTLQDIEVNALAAHWFHLV